MRHPDADRREQYRSWSLPGNCTLEKIGRSVGATMLSPLIELAATLT